jgi:hypothetical protein
MQMEAVMRQPLFAVTVISAFWLSFMATSLVSARYGDGHEDLGKAAIENISVRQQLNVHWKEYGCHDEINRDLLLAPMWCKGKKSAWGDPLYPFRSEGEESKRNMPHIAGAALWWSRSSPGPYASER